MLIKVLYKQLIYLMGQSTVLINSSMTASDLTLDKVIDMIRK